MDGIERPLNELTLQTFTERMGDGFRVQTNSGAVELLLVDAVALPARGNLHRNEPFSIVFRGPVSPRLPQRIHAFRHETIGAFEIFIVPVAPDDLGPRYEAVFN